MKSYNKWKDDKKSEFGSRNNRFGGLVPNDLERAKKVDLITLPSEVQGTNCGNCKYYVPQGDHGWCEHKKVQMYVNKRMCCALWDHEDVERPWGEQKEKKK